MEVNALTLAAHDQDQLYWEGGHYELSMSFDGLRDRQWLRVLQAIWTHPRLHGPLDVRYVPGAEIHPVEIAVPSPTATQTQHGRIDIGVGVVGCDVLATRSLFECISILIPLGMFTGLTTGGDVRQGNRQLVALDEALYDVALAVYDVAPFSIAAIGLERDCQVSTELQHDPVQRTELVRIGNFLARQSLLQGLQIETTSYQAVQADLLWARVPGE